MGTLKIPNVNLKMLEKQRLLLVSVAFKMELKNCIFTQEEISAVDGVINMLDSWSDDIYYNKIERR